MADHSDETPLDADRFATEAGASTGDARENDPADAGFTQEDDRVFRSHFQRVNRLADRIYEQVRPAYELGYRTAAACSDGRGFEDLEQRIENGWLSVRTPRGDWASVREFARAGFDRRMAFGRVSAATPAGTTRSHDRPSFADPVPADLDPTAPASPEQTLEFQHEDNRGPEWNSIDRGNTGMDAEADKRPSDEP